MPCKISALPLKAYSTFQFRAVRSAIYGKTKDVKDYRPDYFHLNRMMMGLHGEFDENNKHDESEARLRAIADDAGCGSARTYCITSERRAPGKQWTIKTPENRIFSLHQVYARKPPFIPKAERLSCGPQAGGVTGSLEIEVNGTRARSNEDEGLKAVLPDNNRILQLLTLNHCFPSKTEWHCFGQGPTIAWTFKQKVVCGDS